MENLHSAQSSSRISDHFQNLAGRNQDFRRKPDDPDPYGLKGDNPNQRYSDWLGVAEIISGTPNGSEYEAAIRTSGVSGIIPDTLAILHIELGVSDILSGTPDSLECEGAYSGVPGVSDKISDTLSQSPYLASARVFPDNLGRSQVESVPLIPSSTIKIVGFRVIAEAASMEKGLPQFGGHPRKESSF